MHFQTSTGNLSGPTALHLFIPLSAFSLRIVIGCLCHTRTDHLPVLSGIQPADLRGLGAKLSLAQRGSLDPDHVLYGLLSGYGLLSLLSGENLLLPFNT